MSASATNNPLLDAVDAAIQFVSKSNSHSLKYDEKVAENENNHNNLISKLPFSPAAERNKAPIFSELKNILPTHGIVLEMGSRHGQHCQYFGEQIYSSDLKSKIKCKWQPTDYINETFKQIEQRRDFSPVDIKSFILKPKLLNLLDQNWESKYQNQEIKLIYIANVIHITDWKCSIGLFRGAGNILKAGDKLALYGPFIINDGKHDDKNQSNLRFSKSLKSRNGLWGVRNIEDLCKLGDDNGLKHAQQINMPANNYIMIFQKVSSRL